jgi:histone H3/H4
MEKSPWYLIGANSKNPPHESATPSFTPPVVTQIQMSTPQRAQDLFRAQMALNSVLQSDPARREMKVDQGCSDLLVEYAEGLAEHVLAEAAKLAKHRGKAVVEPVDLNLVLVKKFGMKVNTPDVALPRLILHHEALGAGYGSMLHSQPASMMLNIDEGMAAFQEKKTASSQKNKRKHSEVGAK